ncbi:MAG: hypothetical protein K6G27_05865 [Lachnospiraceae bacterium]|nr:hypothetical protein [Lachnospiraceae bacterium]
MFTRKELAYFNVCRRVYPWIGNCAVSSGLILITDNMFNKEWRFFKYSLEGVDYYVIKTRPDDNGQFILCTVESFDMAMIALEKILWNKASSEQPDLSKIPLEYVLSAPARLNMRNMSTLFLYNILPFKTGVSGS